MRGFFPFARLRVRMTSKGNHNSRSLLGRTNKKSNSNEAEMSKALVEVGAAEEISAGSAD
jgi:hypothetical protein